MSASPPNPSWNATGSRPTVSTRWWSGRWRSAGPRQSVLVIDDDLGVSGSGTAERSGFARLTAEVALGHVGIVVGLEVSRLARNNADWYRLLDLCGITDTLIGDEDGVYHPASFNDRLVLGLKGTMSEAELHVLRARLEGGIRNKAARGELRRGLPVGLVWGEADGEILSAPRRGGAGDHRHHLRTLRPVRLGPGRVAVAAGRTTRHPAAGHRRQQPARPDLGDADLQRGPPVLTHPSYAGAYVYGRTRQERYVDEAGRTRSRKSVVGRDDWQVLIVDHHPGYIDWPTFEANQARIDANTRPRAHEAGGAVREGCALLQGLATCGCCGRRLTVHYHGARSSRRLSLQRARTGRRPRRDPPVRRWRPDRPRRVGCVPGRHRSRRHPRVGGRCRSDRKRPRRRPGPVAPRSRTGPLQGAASPATLPGRRPRQPARGPRVGGRLGTGSRRAGRGPSRTRPP